MTLHNMHKMIYHRKSCRSFTGKPVDGEMMEQILSFDLKPLYPEIKVRMDVVGRDKVKCLCPWTTPQLIAIYSEETEGWLENAGFLFQQMDLYLQTLGLGACWLGMGKMNEISAPQAEGMKFVILLAFGHPKGDALRHDRKEFRRKPLSQIADREDSALEPARLAPSSVNNQPWYFVHEGDILHAYCSSKGLASYMKRIDVGIALAHLYVANHKTFRFLHTETAPTVAKHSYIGSVKL